MSITVLRGGQAVGFGTVRGREQEHALAGMMQPAQFHELPLARSSAEIEKPLPSALPKVARSGAMSKTSWPPPMAQRNPLIVSSNTSNAPWRWARARKPLQEVRRWARRCGRARG